MADRHIRRGGEAYAEALTNLLPTGPAWPRDRDSVLQAVVAGLADIWGDKVDARAADLLERETDPRLALELLDEWETAFGIPDQCFGEEYAIEARHNLLLFKMTLLGGQSRQWFIYIAAYFGYTIRIREFAPFMCGISECGDTRPDPMDDPYGWRWEIGPPEIRFWWTVRVDDASLQWFRASSGQAGVDPHLIIGTATDLECYLQRFKPAHTEVTFDYSGLQSGGPMAGTP